MRGARVAQEDGWGDGAAPDIEEARARVHNALACCKRAKAQMACDPGQAGPLSEAVGGAWDALASAVVLIEDLTKN